jgi:hypothetical protein
LQTRKIEPAYFHLGFGGESLPVFRHASGRTETHVPVAMNSEAKFTATVIATQIQDWTQIVASVIRYKSIGAHHKPPASARACSISKWRFVNQYRY